MNKMQHLPWPVELCAHEISLLKPKKRKLENTIKLKKILRKSQRTADLDKFKCRKSIVYTCMNSILYLVTELNIPGMNNYKLVYIFLSLKKRQ